jgi:short-subunit dehydrogenase
MALEALTDALRREMSLFGVHVAMVNPGAVATSIVAKVGVFYYYYYFIHRPARFSPTVVHWKADAANEALLQGMSPAMSTAYANITRAFIKVCLFACFVSTAPFFYVTLRTGPGPDSIVCARQRHGSNE